jgi:hypothetical protein
MRKDIFYNKSMKVLSLKKVTRNDSPIYYRRLFSALASIELLGRTEDCPIEFTIETKPAGNNEITITSFNEPDYPRLPLLNALKEFIAAEDKNGGFPN